MRWRAIFLACAMGVVAVAPAAAQRGPDLATGITEEEVAVTSDYRGARLTVFGVHLLRGQGRNDVVIILRGPGEREIVRRKRRILGLWINADPVRFDDAPSFYSIASTRPIGTFLSASTIANLGLDPGARARLDGSTPDDSDPAAYRRALVRLKKAAGLYRESPQGLRLEDDGAFKAYDFVGVTTNSPEYGWHQVNVRNYIHLTNIDPNGPLKLPTGYELQPIEGGTGFGMFGLPGDYTSPSRFVRALNLSSYMTPFDSDEGIDRLYAAFRTVIIPPGLEHAGDNNPLSDFSQYWAGYDVTNRTMYVQSSLGLGITSKKLDPSAVTEITYQKVDLTNSPTVLT